MGRALDVCGSDAACDCARGRVPARNHMGVCYACQMLAGQVAGNERPVQAQQPLPSLQPSTLLAPRFSLLISARGHLGVACEALQSRVVGVTAEVEPFGLQIWLAAACRRSL